MLYLTHKVITIISQSLTHLDQVFTLKLKLGLTFLCVNQLSCLQLPKFSFDFFLVSCCFVVRFECARILNRAKIPIAIFCRRIQVSCRRIEFAYNRSLIHQVSLSIQSLPGPSHFFDMNGWSPRLVLVFGSTPLTKRCNLNWSTDATGCCSRYLSWIA